MKHISFSRSRRELSSEPCSLWSKHGSESISVSCIMKHISFSRSRRELSSELVLVDVYADPELLVAYVAEENLSEADESEKGRFEHPYTEFLFYGEDMARDFIPVKQLHEKYDQPRYEAEMKMTMMALQIAKW